jgi:hypothetical protein
MVTYTFAELELSPAAYYEISQKMRAAGWDQAFTGPGSAIDMHGIGVTCGSSPEQAHARRLDQVHRALEERRAAMKGKGWIGVDLDGTLAHWGRWVAFDDIGEPIEPMVDRVRDMIAEGFDVRIFTARVHTVGLRWCPVRSRHYTPEDAVAAVQQWCLRHIGCMVPVTCVKDGEMIELWDDRAIQVVSNTGRTIYEELAAELVALSGAP